MSNGHPVLAMASLRERHPPIGLALLLYAPAVIVRLSLDPTQLVSGIMRREVKVNSIKRSGDGVAEAVVRCIDWTDTFPDTEVVCQQLPFTKNEHTITEEAAIGILALLISDLEEGTLQTVLPIGSGGDYLIQVPEPSVPIQVEVSGIREDKTGSSSRSRLSEKTEQVLRKSRIGFVSVTTFAHEVEKVVHSYLHFVRKRGKSKGKPAKKGGKK